MTNPCNPVEQQARADYIEALYQASGRTNGLYTGIFQNRIDQLILIDKAEVLLQQRKLNDATP
jgi:hypothetical protein